jgi:hypothetical protein
VVFSRIFPQGFPQHDSHPLWVRATELGAQCSLSVTAETTHVVTVEAGTEKARWAKQEGKFVVRPEWLECCQVGWPVPWLLFDEFLTEPVDEEGLRFRDLLRVSDLYQRVQSSRHVFPE